jgi:MFS family permease
LIAFYAVGGLIYAAMARHLVTRLGQARMATVGGCIMGAGYLCWMLSPVAWTAAPVALAVGFGTYMLHNTLQTHATQMAPWARGTAVALFACSMFTGQALGALLAGRLHDHAGMGAALAAPVVMLPLTGWLFAHALRRKGATPIRPG